MSEIAVVLQANAAPLADTGKLAGGLSLRLRPAPDEKPIALFDRAPDPDARSSDGNLQLGDWSVGDRRVGASGNVVRVQASLLATYAFLDRLAAAPQAAFELAPLHDRQMPDVRSEARTLSLSLARTADVVARLRQACPGTQRRPSPFSPLATRCRPRESGDPFLRAADLGSSPNVE